MGLDNRVNIRQNEWQPAPFFDNNAAALTLKNMVAQKGKSCPQFGVNVSPIAELKRL